MPLSGKPTRYAHQEGHCDVCYFTGKKKGLITCGSDGDVRTWVNLLDDDPASECIAEQVLCVVSKGEKIYAGNDNNTVQVLNHQDFAKAGILTSFSSSVSALATNNKSNLIASGGCDFRIRVSNVDNLEYTELEGHEAPILALSLDPKEVYVASSSADGSIKVWNIKKKSVAQTYFGVVPKCNSFFSAKVYGTPSFECKDGKYLAYPHEKDIIVVERDIWSEAFRLKYPTIKADFNICKFSECGTLLAASSLYGEIVVWKIEDKSVVGYIAHPSDAKITALAWKPGKPNEIAFCDAMGQLGCVDVDVPSTSDYESRNFEIDDITELKPTSDNDSDEDNENVFSISKIKGDLEDGDRSSRSSSPRRYEPNVVLPKIELQEHFQPSSTPSHLLSHFMVWNDVGIVTYFKSDYDESSSIEVEFHETATHHSLRIMNYLNHTMAALSSEALVLSCPSSEEGPSKLVVVVLQGWGSGNKEWTVELPENEESYCVAAGDNFVAVATNKRFVRLFTISGVQRDILAIPGSVVTMNAYKHHLVVVYHSGIGASKDQHMQMMWIKISGRNLCNKTLTVPLSEESKLRWVGLTDSFVPAVYDTNDILKIYNQKSALWTVVCDMKSLLPGQNDHYFLISVSSGYARAIACKGSYYPVTSPRPFAVSVPLSLPLCEPDDDKTKIEIKICKMDCDSSEEDAAILELIALSCRKNAEYRVVDICEHFASQKVVELAMKYAARINRQPLVKKLQAIAESKYSRRLEENKRDDEDVEMFDDFSKENDEKDLIEKDDLNLSSSVKKSDFALKPLPFVPVRRSNPFSKSKVSSPKLSGLEALSCKEDNVKTSPVVKSTTTTSVQSSLKSLISVSSKKEEKKAENKSETFISWFSRNKSILQDENPDMSMQEITKLALTKFKEKEKNSENNDNLEEPESKKRKYTDDDSSQTNGTPKSTAAKLASFARKL